jgi:hypothetical protein
MELSKHRVHAQQDNKTCTRKSELNSLKNFQA